MPEYRAHARMIQQQAETGEGDQHRAQRSRQDVPLRRAAVQGLLAPVQRIQHHQDGKVEHGAAQHIADSDVRRVGERDGGNSGHQFR